LSDAARYVSVEGVEVAIVGAGPAGLSAALVLGRCRRRVVVFDSGAYRNARSHALRGFLTRDGVSPEDFRRIARTEIARYQTVEFRDDVVTDVVREHADSFIVHSQRGIPLACRKLLLATGLTDVLPPVAGSEDLFGAGVYSCPYCDAWELRDQPLATYDRQGRYSLALSQWSQDLVVCTDGRTEIEPETRRRLEQLGARVDERRIARFRREAEHVCAVFDNGDVLRRRAIFVNGNCRPRSDLPAKLGCTMDERGGVCVDRHESTSVSGVYVAGDASRDALQAVVAAGEGASAAIAINSALNRIGTG
jgi:thioredoxin reductase